MKQSFGITENEVVQTLIFFKNGLDLLKEIKEENKQEEVAQEFLTAGIPALKIIDQYLSGGQSMRTPTDVRLLLRIIQEGEAKFLLSDCMSYLVCTCKEKEPVKILVKSDPNQVRNIVLLKKWEQLPVHGLI